MLSDEEKKAIDKLKRSANYFVMPIYETKIILELIEKQSKEIEELKEKNEFLNWYFENQKENFVHKDKIKARIEEYENKIKKIRSKKLINEPEDTIVITRYAHYISVLQSLLEKE